MSLPGYSICIVHYGEVQLTAECLRSTLELRYPPQQRFLVWNDPEGSPDSLPGELLREVELLQPGKNLGFAAGANLGLQAALQAGESDAVWLLNNDLRVERDAARPLAAALAGDDSVAVAGPRILEYSGMRIWHDGGEIHWPQGRPFSPRLGQPLGERLPGNPFEVEFISGCAPMMRAKAFQQLGGYDERYFLFYEDADLSLRLKAQGWRLLQVPAALVRHHGSASVGEASPRSRYYRLRNRLLFSREHAPQPVAAAWARRRLRLENRLRAYRYLISGRRAGAKAILSALRDAKAGRWGRGSEI
ncbi:MAG: glycosyltransferase family 2 protein [Planctomycetota bacterium]